MRLARAVLFGSNPFKRPAARTIGAAVAGLRCLALPLARATPFTRSRQFARRAVTPVPAFFTGARPSRYLFLGSRIEPFPRSGMWEVCADQTRWMTVEVGESPCGIRRPIRHHSPAGVARPFPGIARVPRRFFPHRPVVEFMVVKLPLRRR